MKISNFLSCSMRLLPLALAFGAALAQQFIPPHYHASPIHVARLPKYCHQQYVNGALGGPEYSIPNSMCGGQMNHFCPALVFMQDVENLSLPRNERRGALGHTIEGIEYTIRGMKPGCYLEPEVLAAKQKALMLQKIYGPTLQ